MPELPEVETVRRGLAPHMEGATIRAVQVRRKDLRFPFPERFAERLKDRRVIALGRRAKYLLADLDSGEVVIMHLGMSGSFRIESDVVGEYHHARSRLAAHDHVVLDFDNGTRITYNDPRRFGFMLMAPRTDLDNHPFFAELGPEPVGNALDADGLARAFSGARRPIKTALLDQSVIAGLGNIYVCEALFRAHIHPTTPVGHLVDADGRASPRLQALVPIIRTVIAEAIEAGGSTLRDHAQPDGELGYFQHRFQVYDREGEPCFAPGCAASIQRMVQAGRSTFFCASCQPEPERSPA